MPRRSEDWSGEAGFIHEVVQRHLRAEAPSGVIDAYACGPPPMIDAMLPILHMNNVDLEHIHFDRFTPAAALKAASPERATREVDTSDFKRRKR